MGKEWYTYDEIHRDRNIPRTKEGILGEKMEYIQIRTHDWVMRGANMDKYDELLDEWNSLKEEVKTCSRYTYKKIFNQMVARKQDDDSDDQLLGQNSWSVAGSGWCVRSIELN